jgi:hypothetical protein
MRTPAVGLTDRRDPTSGRRVRRRGLRYFTPGVGASAAFVGTGLWFGAGDHALVSFNGAVYDPSYGTGPYASASGCAAVGCWAQANIAGLATMVAYPGTLGNVYQAQQCPASPPAGLGLRDAAVPFECVWRVTDANPAHNWNYAPPAP